MARPRVGADEERAQLARNAARVDRFLALARTPEYQAAANADLLRAAANEYVMFRALPHVHEENAAAAAAVRAAAREIGSIAARLATDLDLGQLVPPGDVSGHWGVFFKDQFRVLWLSAEDFPFIVNRKKQ